MSKVNSAVVQRVYHTQMRDVARNAFGKDYLDTETNECQHIREMFKDWDRQIYSQIHNQDIGREGTAAEMANHIHRYNVNLEKHVNDMKKNGFDITKYRKSGEFMYK